MLIIGSKALQAHCLNPERSGTQDTDIISTYDQMMAFIHDLNARVVLNGGGFLTTYYPISGNKFVVKDQDSNIYEFEIAWEGSTAAQLLQLTKDDVWSTTMCDGNTYASPELVYTLKMSHRFLKNSPHFLKTMSDIWFLRNEGYGTIPDNLKDWFHLREKETYDYKHPNLNQSKGMFFSNDQIQYVYDHDSIHEAMKVLTTQHPAYTYYKGDNKDVLCSKEKWDNVGGVIQRFGVYEEALVLALERSQIPHGNKLTPKESFDIALEKVCTSITSGWFREYAWEHYGDIQAIFHVAQAKRCYVERFKDALWRDEVVTAPRTIS